MEQAYLFFDKNYKNSPLCNSDEVGQPLFFAYSDECAKQYNASLGVERYYAKKVSDCTVDLQKRYKKRIDELVANGELKTLDFSFFETRNYYLKSK